MYKWDVVARSELVVVHVIAHDGGDVNRQVPALVAKQQVV